MRDEWAQLVKSGGWDSKQYLHYLVNMYGTGVCGVLPGQRLKSAKISANLTYEISTFITKVLLLEVVGSSKIHLQEWSATLRDHLEVDDGNIFVQTLYEMIGQLHIFRAPDMPTAVKLFIAHLAKDQYKAEKGFDYFTCESIQLGPYFNLYSELKRRWNTIFMKHPLFSRVMPTTMRQLSGCFYQGQTSRISSLPYVRMEYYWYWMLTYLLLYH